MPLTLTREQQDFMRDGNRVRNLAQWVLSVDNHIATKVRREAGVQRSVAPTRRETQHMVDFLSGGQANDSDLVHLINGYNFRHTA